MIPIDLMTAAKFSAIIDTIVQEKQITYMDAIIYYCERHDFEIEQAAKLVSPKIKRQLKLEAQELNFLAKPKGRLPV